MPRRHPLNDQEAGICRRLREFRETQRISRADFAKLIGVDSSVVASCELGRTKLSYGLFLRVYERFPKLDAKWLATGKGVMVVLAPKPAMPRPEELVGGERALFSDAFQTRIHYALLAASAKVWISGEPVPAHVDVEPGASGRSALLSLMDNWLEEHLHQIPDLEIPRFAQGFFEFADGFMRNLGDAAILPLENQAVLDLAGASFEDRCVPTIPENIDALMLRVREAASRRGIKSWLASELGVSRQAVDQWLTERPEKRRYPSADVAIRLVNLLNSKRFPGEVSPAKGRGGER